MDSTIIEINRLEHDGYNQIWIGTNNGLRHASFRMDKIEVKSLFDTFLAGSNVFEERNQFFPVRISSGSILAFSKKGLFDISYGTAEKFLSRKLSDSLISDDLSYILLGIKKLIRSSSGKIWIVANKSKSGVVDETLYSFDPDELLTTEYRFKVFRNIGIEAVEEDDSGRIWIAADQLFCSTNSINFGKKPQLIEIENISIKYKRLFNDNNIDASTLLLDHSQTLWLGSSSITKGYILNSITYYDFSQILSGRRSITNVVEDLSRNLWIGTTDQGLFRVNLVSGGIKRYDGISDGASKPCNNPYNPDSRSFSTYPYSIQNNLFVGTFNGIAKYNATSDSFSLTPIVIESPNIGYTGHTITRICYDPSGKRILCLTNDSRNPLLLFDEIKGVFEEFSSPPGFFYQFFPQNLNLHCGIKGTWISIGKGLFKLSDKSNVIDLSKILLPNLSIRKILEDHSHALWIVGTLGELFRFDPETKELHDVTDNLEMNTRIWDLTEAENNVLWLSTDLGLISYKSDCDDISNCSFLHSEFGPSYRILSLSDGRIATFGEQGLLIFHPDSVLNLVPPKNLITDLIIDDHSVILEPNDGEDGTNLRVDLNYDENNTTIEYLGLHFIDPLKNRYRVQLSGIEDEWRNVGEQRSMSYFNLAPGSYLFKVSSSNKDGVWSDVPASLAINIRPPWWKSWWAWGIYISFFLLALWRLHLFQRSRTIRQAKDEAREKELEQSREIEAAYVQLKTTQAQLIYAEKMASLGELTAGIAHEIQNPLNFVNNFSEVNNELIGEAESEIDSGNIDEVKIILRDIKDNGERIFHHGTRADSIVKNMLQHSRKSTGERETTDINALCTEFVHLAYHGIKSKDDGFNAEINIYLDPDLPKIKVVPQDIGRVLLNLINNAFQAVKDNDGAKVYVSTRKFDNYIEIKVSDNGPGVGDEIRDKIFQPFFTTKPTGQGTGLGLSIAYDIVKAHNGEINFENGEDGGVEFMISLPIS